MTSAAVCEYPDGSGIATRICKTHFRSIPAAIFTTGESCLLRSPAILWAPCASSAAMIPREKVQVCQDRWHIQGCEAGGDVEDLVDDYGGFEDGAGAGGGS